MNEPQPHHPRMASPTPMSQRRFLDRFRNFKGEPQQVSGASMLYDAIEQGWKPEKILIEEADWARKFSEKPPGLDPRGSEEAGMVGPKIPAPAVPGDSYLLVNDRDQDAEAYDHTGAFLWRAACLARGQGADNVWTQRNSDTPPGLYRLGQLYDDYDQNPNPPCNDTAMAYGWFSFDMEELEGQEAANGRAGIMLHGGGSACGWPGAWVPRQKLYPTQGCIRMYNRDLRDLVLPLYRKGTVYVGVFQEP